MAREPNAKKLGPNLADLDAYQNIFRTGAYVFLAAAVCDLAMLAKSSHPTLATTMFGALLPVALCVGVIALAIASIQEHLRYEKYWDYETQQAFEPVGKRKLWADRFFLATGILCSFAIVGSLVGYDVGKNLIVNSDAPSINLPQSHLQAIFGLMIAAVVAGLLHAYFTAKPKTAATEQLVNIEAVKSGDEHASRFKKVQESPHQPAGFMRSFFFNPRSIALLGVGTIAVDALFYQTNPTIAVVGALLIASGFLLEDIIRSCELLFGAESSKHKKIEGAGLSVSTAAGAGVAGTLGYLGLTKQLPHTIASGPMLAMLILMGIAIVGPMLSFAGKKVVEDKGYTLVA